MSEYLPGELCLGTLNSPSPTRGIEWTADSLSWCHFGVVWLALFPFPGYHYVHVQQSVPQSWALHGAVMGGGNKSNHPWPIHQPGPVGSSCSRWSELIQRSYSHHPSLISVSYWINTQPILLIKLILDKERKWDNRVLVPKNSSPVYSLLPNNSKAGISNKALHRSVSIV